MDTIKGLGMVTLHIRIHVRMPNISSWVPEAKLRLQMELNSSREGQTEPIEKHANLFTTGNEVQLSFADSHGSRSKGQPCLWSRASP